MNKSSCFSISSPRFDVGTVLDFSHSNMCVVVSYCFNLQFPNDTWCWTSISVLTTYIYSWVRCLFRSFVHFLIGLFVFLLLRCFFEFCILLSFLHIWVTSPLSYMCFANISSSVFHSGEVFNFIKFQLTNFFFAGSRLVWYVRSHHPTQC